MGLKRGERLQAKKLKGRTGKVGLLLRVLVVGAALVVLYKQVGGRLGVLDVVGKCDAGFGEVDMSVWYEEFVGEGVLSGRVPCHELRRRFVSFSASCI